MAEAFRAAFEGVVSLPHGWGHTRPGVRLRVAAAHAGASVNDITDEQFVDQLTGNIAFSGVPVDVSPVDSPGEALSVADASTDQLVADSSAPHSF